MFKLKPFISLAFLSIIIVFMVQANIAHSDDSSLTNVVASSQIIDINSADAETLASAMKGIGIKKAKAIVEYRAAYGPFHDVEELVEVKGIGKSTLDKNRALLVAN